MSQVAFRDLSVLGYAKGTTHWVYGTKHSRREVEGNTYWDEAFDLTGRNAPGMIKPGDLIFITHETAEAFGNSIYAMGLNGKLKLVATTFSEE